MKQTHLIAPAAVLIAFTLIAAPAQAEQRGGDNRGRSVAHGRTVDGTGAGRWNSQDRVRIDQPANRMDRQRRDGGYQQSREGGYRQMSGAAAVPRVVGPRVMAPRVGSFDQRRTVIIDPYRYRTYGARSSVYRRYTFRPRFSIGLGLFVGDPIPYPYYDPYAYPAPPPYGYGYPGPNASVSAPTSVVAYGGVSLDMTPGQAAVYADGAYVGPASDFSDPSRPLSLAAGPHRIEVRAPGFAPVAFDVNVEPGQVTPYRGDLQPIR